MSEGIWNLDPIFELPFLWLLLLSPHWYVSNSIPSHKKLVMVSANVHHISFWVWTCVILLRPQHDGLSRAGFAHLVGCYTLCSAKQTWPRDLGKVCVLQLDRSQSLFYFVPQSSWLNYTYHQFKDLKFWTVHWSITNKIQKVKPFLSYFCIFDNHSRYINDW